MNSETTKRPPLWPWALGIIGTFLILAALAAALMRQTEPPPLDAKRKAERSAALAELRAAEAQALSTAAWTDRGKGLVRLPVDVAMERVLQAWQEPEAGKKELVRRVRIQAAVPAAEGKSGEAGQTTPAATQQGKAQ